MDDDQLAEAWRQACEGIKPGRTPPASRVSAMVAELLGVPEGIDEEGGIDEDLAEVLEGLTPDRQQKIVQLVEDRANRAGRKKGDDPAPIETWKFCRSEMRFWLKVGDMPKPALEGFELAEKARQKFEAAAELKKKRG